MNYCSIEEAWGSNNFKDSRKKNKTKRLYTTKIPPHVYDTSYEEGGHDESCQEVNKKMFTVKNKNRFDKSRGPKDIHRPERSSRVNNINLRHDEARNEYKKYKKETKRNNKNKLSREDIIENDIYPPIFSNNEVSYIDGDGLSPIQENDMELEDLPEGQNLSNAYQVLDDQNINNKMQQLQQEQSKVLEQQRNVINKQMQNQGIVSNIEQFDNYYQNNNIEAFEGNGGELDTMKLEESDEDESTINEVDSIAPGPQSSNYVDKILTNNKRSRAPISSENDSENDSDSENEEEQLQLVDNNSKDLQYQVSNLNRNVNLIIKKMNDTQIFDEDSQENVHDLILFILFGIFIIFVLDTIYRFGRQSRD